MARKILTGIAVSVGVAIGSAFFMNRQKGRNIPRQTIAEDLVEAEVARLDSAFQRVDQELSEARDKIPGEFREHAAIIDSHLMILKDPKLLQATRNYVTSMRLNAEWALEKAMSDIEEAFKSIDDEYIRARIQDVRTVSGRVQQRLAGEDFGLKAINSRVILVAHDISPADTAELEVDKIMAFATTQGGKTSHTGIMARSLQIPAVVGVESLEDEIRDGQTIIVDGLNGRILVEPDASERIHYSNLKRQFESYQAGIMRCCWLPGETVDGYRVHVLANIELYEEVATVIDHGGEGIGLYRTEYSFLNRLVMPGEEELYEEYRDLAAIMSPNKVVIRTLDLGADKMMKHYGDLEEANPAMGLRAIRFCLRHPELFKSQLRAILRASTLGNVSIMFPMISGLKELRDAKAVLQVCMDELTAEGRSFDAEIPVGIMVEVPAVVMTADLMAREVDFFSIGTNDLIQYSLGIDRTNKYVSYLYQPLHPAVVRSIKQVVDAGHQAGIEVSLCGEVASDPFCVPILMGMEIDSISLNPQAIPGIKRILRQASMSECKELLRAVLASESIPKTNALVRDTIFKRFPEEIMFFSSMLDND